jgi:hypothetical protein
MAASKIENTAQVLSCLLKFVHGITYIQPWLELKTQPRFSLVSKCLSMDANRTNPNCVTSPKVAMTRKANLNVAKTFEHRHLSNIDCLMACTTCLVCFISTVNGCNKKEALEDRH